jgi:hypothetical protein
MRAWPPGARLRVMSGTHAPVRSSHRVAVLPATGLGRWAVGLAVANVVLVLGWSLLGPLGALPGFACGLAGGIAAIAAIRAHGERAITVWLAIVPLAMVVLFVIGELLIGHG